MCLINSSRTCFVYSRFWAAHVFQRRARVLCVYVCVRARTRVCGRACVPEGMRAFARAFVLVRAACVGARVWMCVRVREGVRVRAIAHA